MSFDVSAEAYEAFMGGYSELLTDEFLAVAAIPAQGRVLDVGCGPGALTARLVEQRGADAVSAVDPSGSFVEAARARLPGVDVRVAGAAALPYPDGTFAAALAQLVVHFLPDPVAGLRELARVTHPGGVVAACVWDHADGGGPLSAYWSAVRELDPEADDESDLPGAREGDLVRLAAEAGLADVRGGRVSVTRGFASFEQWWRPFTYGVGPAGQYVRHLDDAARERLQRRCAETLPDGAFEITAAAWTVRGTVA